LTEAKIEKKHCEKHNINYDSHTVTIGKRVITQPCPSCVKSELIEQANIKKWKQVEFRQKQLSEKFRKSGIPPRYTTRAFANFNCRNHQQSKALEMAKAYSKKIIENRNTGIGLILSGKPGTGKTHLACAIGREYMHIGNVMFITVSAMIRQIRSSYQHNSIKTEQDVINQFRNIDLLIIDEIGVQKGTESEEYLLFEVINERYSYFKSTILVSNHNAAKIKGFIGERALDRMKEGGGMFIAFDWDSYRANVASDVDLPLLSEAKYC